MPARPCRPGCLTTAQRRCCPPEASARRHAAGRPAAHRRWLAVPGPHGCWPQQRAPRACRDALRAVLRHSGHRQRSCRPPP
eukprot:5052453-Lingulodinium_polyedra.AAC.1